MTRQLLVGISLVILLGTGGLFAWNQGLLSEDEPNQGAQNTQIQTGLEGQAAPEFSLKNLAGKAVKLSDYRGKLVFLNFWATWCEPCKEEMPSMERLYQNLKNEPFELLAVSLDQGDHQKAIQDFMSKNKVKISFPILHDPGELTAKKSYRTTGVPESFIIDSEGKVIKHVIGMYEWDSAPILNYFKDQIKKIPRQ